MKSGLLWKRILEIQSEYHDLLSSLLNRLQTSYAPEIMDEINLFWVRRIEVVRLYLKNISIDNECCVFTAATYMDFSDKEHLPFLLVGDIHILDDPLGKYSEIYKQKPTGKDAELLYEQICSTAIDNLAILEHAENHILILPFRLLNQFNHMQSLYDIGEQFFTSLFDGINSLDDYFSKCTTIDDVIKYARKDIDNLVLFSENDDKLLPLKQRYTQALKDTTYMVDERKPDSYNFFILVFGCIQQAVDVILSCVEYHCFPYIRYPVALHYIALLSGCMQDIDHIRTLRYVMSVTFVVYRLCDKERLASIPLHDYLENIQQYHFHQRLFQTLAENGINEDTFLQHKIQPFVLNAFGDLYSFLDQ